MALHRTMIEPCSIGHHSFCPGVKVFEDMTILCTCPCRHKESRVLSVARYRVAEAAHDQFVADFGEAAAEDGCLEILIGLQDYMLTEEDIRDALERR